MIGRPLAEVLTLRDQDGVEWFASNCPYDGLNIRSGIPEQPWFLPNGQEVLVVARLQRSGFTSQGRWRRRRDALGARSGQVGP